MANSVSTTCLQGAALAALVLTLVPSLVGAAPFDDHRAALESRLESVEPGNCDTERSDDYYGLGVRLGVYLSWVQAWLAFNFVPSEISSALDTNTMFLFAILVAMVRCTITKLIVQVDGLVLMHLGAGTIFSVLSIWGYRTGYYVREGPTKGISHFGGFGMHMRLLLCVAFAAYGLYFWMFGITGPTPGLTPGSGESSIPGCEPLYTFMFSKQRADGGIRFFYIVCTIGSLAYWGTQLLVSSLAAAARPAKMYKLGMAGQWRTTSRLDFATGLSYGQLRYMFQFLRVGTLLWIIFSMITVEFTLNYNRMQNVLGWQGHLFFPSQLIPLIIGIIGLLRVCYTAYEQWRSPEDTDPSLVVDSPITPTQAATLPHGKKALKIFAPKTVAGNGPRSGSRAKAEHEDDEMDPLLDGQPAWLRYLVSYLPWLVLVRWWHLKDRDFEKTAYADPPPFHVAPPEEEHSRVDGHRSWDSRRSTVYSRDSMHNN